MTSPEEIEKIAESRLEEAAILLGAGKFDGAYYLAGYSVELVLKARICRTLGIPNLFDEVNKNTDTGIGDLRKFLKTHDLSLLLLINGLKYKFDADKANNKHLFIMTSVLFNHWDENARYHICGTVTKAKATSLITSLQDKDGVIEWIKKN